MHAVWAGNQLCDTDTRQLTSMQLPDTPLTAGKAVKHS
jgi:hypothetical protein